MDPDCPSAHTAPTAEVMTCLCVLQLSNLCTAEISGYSVSGGERGGGGGGSKWLPWDLWATLEAWCSRVLFNPPVCSAAHQEDISYKYRLNVTSKSPGVGGGGLPQLSQSGWPSAGDDDDPSDSSEGLQEEWLTCTTTDLYNRYIMKLMSLSTFSSSVANLILY